MKYQFLLLCCLCLSSTQAQERLQGKVQDEMGKPVFAANVYCKNQPTKGTTTDLEGNFQFKATDSSDTLVVSFIGYQAFEFPLKNLLDWTQIQVQLKANAQMLSEVMVRATNPISEQFAVTKLSRLDIYMNPVSQGDPLKAITSLPSSTNSNETASPALRASDPDRTRVVMNGIPIYKPVRASQLNNQGFFSLFNPEIIGQQYVYASNPPLTVGNTSAGLVEINTIQELEKNSLQLSATLASMGAFLSQRIDDDSFLQAYGNLQFSAAFKGIQPNALSNINSFSTKDAGLNFHHKFNAKTNFNSFTYFIDERANIAGEIMTYPSNFLITNKRVFTLSTLTHLLKSGALYVRNGTNFAKTSSRFGALFSKNRTNETYTGVDYKHFIKDIASVQIGTAYNYRNYHFRDSVPSLYYDWSEDTPRYFSQKELLQHDLQAYAYANWDINAKWAISSGIRTNIPLQTQSSFWSAQMGFRFKPNRHHHFLLSAGQYHNYSTPNFFLQRFELLRSRQAALDYSYAKNKTRLQGAIYYKNETGERLLADFTTAEQVNTFGIEAFWEQVLSDYLQFSLSNSVIRQRQYIQDIAYRGEQDFNYFVKVSVTYTHPKLCSAALSFSTRPGTAYTPFVGGNLDTNVGVYEPIYGELFSRSFRPYRRLDINLSRYIPLEKSALIPFFGITNLLNTQNESMALYSPDYTQERFDYYQARTFFFGLVWELKY